MKKAFLLILLALTIIAVKSEFHLCNEYSFTNLGDDKDVLEDYCRILSTSQDKTHCCLVQIEDTYACKEISDDAYENIERYKKYMKTNNNYSKFKIKCSSQYLHYSVFALLALLI